MTFSVHRPLSGIYACVLYRIAVQNGTPQSLNFCTLHNVFLTIS